VAAVQLPVHGGDRSQVAALVEQRGVDLSRSEIHEAFLMQNRVEVIAFGRA
jgi:hypothetical protein